MHQKTGFVLLRRSLTIAAMIMASLALLSVGLLSAFAQDDGADYWAEVNIGGPRTVFVPAECVSGLSFEQQSPGAEVDVTETDVNTFQRATIVCDTPLYDLPGGSEIAGEALNQGSSWLVNPVLWPSLSRSALQGETDQQDDEIAQFAPSTETTTGRIAVTSQRWAEVALTPGTPRVYVPAECVAGVPFSETLTWVTSRSESIAQAQEDRADDDLDFSELWLGTVVCDVGLYTTPAGTQIEGEALRAGQVWFVSPYLWSTAPLNTLQATDTVGTTSTGAVGATDTTDTTDTTQDTDDTTDTTDTTDTAGDTDTTDATGS